MKMVKPIILAIGAIPVILAILIVIPMVTMEEIPTSAINSNDKIQEKDKISLIGLDEIAFNKPVKCIICHENNETEEISLTHSYNNLQLEWFRAGSALNVMRHN